jgi:glycosyltransferase involved in cell wall biosynthesis
VIDSGVKLTGLVVCQDEVERIAACLDSLAFCDEIVVVDSGSTDGTLEIVRKTRARLIERAFTSYNDQKEHGRIAARGDWLINIDADEVVSPELAAEALRVIADPNNSCVAFEIPFRNHFRSIWVRRCGYYPDRHVRLMRRDRARWDPETPVHEKVLVEGPIGRLREHVDHYSFDSIDDFVAKSSRYAAIFAAKAYADGRRAGPWTIAAHTAARFLKAYVLKAGFLEGSVGLMVAGLQTYEVFQKYVRLWELGRFPPRGLQDSARAIASEASRGR